MGSAGSEHLTRMRFGTQLADCRSMETKRQAVSRRGTATAGSLVMCAAALALAGVLLRMDRRTLLTQPQPPRGSSRGRVVDPTGVYRNTIGTESFSLRLNA